MKQISIAVYSPSPTIRIGISSIVEKIRENNMVFSPVMANDLEAIGKINPMVVIADPLMLSSQQIDYIKEVTDYKCKIVAFYISSLPASVTRLFDAVISVYDDIATIEDTIKQMAYTELPEDDSKTLSQREKDVVIGVVKGLSNKEIASEMGVSVNTVMTHRRNISSKLQIHSPAGLTIYAIVSNLVKLEEIQMQLPK
jgi:DNA-binding CsgD family transcriptional regulator